MKPFVLAPLILVYAAIAVPTSDSQIVIGDLPDAFGRDLGEGVQYHAAHDIHQSVSLESERVEKWIDWFGRPLLKQDGLVCEPLPRLDVSPSNVFPYQTSLSRIPRSLSIS